MRHQFRYKGVGSPNGVAMRDAGADVEHLKALLGIEIRCALERERLTVRAAQARTGIAAADFSRIRSDDLERFTVDRLVCILNRLGSRVEFSVRLQGEDAAQPVEDVLHPSGDVLHPGEDVSQELELDGVEPDTEGGNAPGLSR
jgi:predicted XRE-type DNA-binding protein